MRSKNKSKNHDLSAGFLIFIFALIILFSGTSPIAAQTTELKVKIHPPEAIHDGAMWRYKEKNSPTATWSLWWHSGQSMELFASVFLVEFKKTNSDNWVTPDIRKVVVNTNEHKVINQTYISSDAESSIKIILNPADIRTNAKWSLFYLPNPTITSVKVYIGKDLTSGETLTFKPQLNVQYIEYSFVKDVARPYTEAITINPGEHKEVTREYKDLIVGKVHIFGNELEYSSDEFKTYGTTQWAFIYSWGSESVRYVKCIGDLKGTFTPAVIKGSGTLHANEDLGLLDKMFSLFSDKTFYKGKFLLDAKTLKTIETSHQGPIWFGYLMYSFTVNDFQIFKHPTFGLSQTALGSFDLPIFSEPSIFRFEELKTYEEDSAPQVTGDIIWEGNEVPGLFKISETEVHIDTSTKTFSAEGFDVEIHQALPSFRGEIKVKEGKVKKLGAKLYDVGKTINDLPIIFDNCGLSFENPANASTKVNISAGVKFVVPGTSFDAGSESWEGDLDINGHLKVSGKKEIFGYEIGNTETEAQWKGSKQFVSSFVDTSFYVSGYVQFLIEGQGFAYLQWKPSFSFNGWIMASGWVPLPDWLSGILPGWLLEQVEDDKINLGSFMVGIDPDGMTISVTILKLFTFKIDIPPFWQKNAGSLESINFAQNNLRNTFTSNTLNTGRVENFKVKPGEAGFILSLQGNGGAPDAILVKPDGTSIDPKNFVSKDDSIHVGTDDDHSVTGFIVNEPQPGIWVVKIMNSAGITQRLIRGNHSPKILPVKLESETNGSYKLTYEAFDADNNAVITFYHSSDNNSFQGQKIGTAVEHDGTGTFTWYPDASITTSGYICAVIDDGINPPGRAYFKGRTISPNAPSAPIFSRAHMSGDILIITFDDLDFTGIDSLNVYYSDDLETDNLTEYFTVFPKSQIELTNNPMAPGRVYQLRVTTFSEINGESDFSSRFEVDYRLLSGNNYPNIISKPFLKARFYFKTDTNDFYYSQDKKVYQYQLKVQDYDNDHIYYSMIRGPEQLNISANGLINGEFSKNEVGSKSVAVQVDDGKGGIDIQKFRIDLTPQNKYDTMSISRSSAEDKLILNLTDVSRNYNSLNIDTITAILQDSFTGIQWSVALQETSVGSCRFQGLIHLKNGEQNMIKSGREGFILRWKKNNGEEQIYKSGK